MTSGPRTGDAVTWETAEVPRPPTASVPERYEIRSLLGQGGKGRVWLAWDRTLRREVAYKELDAARRSAVAVARFLREAELTAGLDHPGIVPIHDAGVRPDGGLYYVMRVIRGVSLAALLRERRSPQARLGLLDAVIDAGRAVAFAHDKGVVHRDLKPENVMIGPFGEAVVVDWGLALSAADVAAAEGTQVVGTPHYMSPESARGEAVDARTDVWALGVVIYEILAGRRPFEGADSWSVVREAAHGRVPPLVAPGVPAELVAVTHRALAPRSDDRYPDAGALVADLVAWRNGLRVSAHT